MVTAVPPVAEPQMDNSQASNRQGVEAMADIDHLDDEVAKDLVQLSKLMSDETRLRILFFLMQQKELNVRTLCELLGQSQPAVSHHLALLRVNGLIEARRDGKHNFYHIVPHRIQEMLGMVFAAAPGQADSIRFGSYELSYTPPHS